ncbi:sigma-70 family RNA polymerase sigma factor [Aestuariibacter sp. GS-14]|uniref:RNA polymerase sigma factor n=1 Tax=Aestuariibacter sp. GS-14 TaxID=2590670 RepID=UPI001125F6A8|nr:sigma-70 family RNA polymerase sigma factor [Aestuariibacter sp. GS-14]TPV60770.1 sigma-70 family RNA polymerase sigma factor [Aestuariibacter sp. GS-14]
MQLVQDPSTSVHPNVSGDTHRELVSCFIANQHALKGYIRKSVPQESDVEDVFQRLLVRVLGKHWDEQIDSPLAYGYRITRNLIIDFQREQKRLPDALPDDEQTDYLLESEALETMLEHQERVQIYQAVVSAMSPKRREIFIRRRLHGESRDAIARDMNLTEEAVKKHITRALDELKREIEKRYAEKCT